MLAFEQSNKKLEASTLQAAPHTCVCDPGTHVRFQIFCLSTQGFCALQVMVWQQEGCFA